MRRIYKFTIFHKYTKLHAAVVMNGWLSESYLVLDWMNRVVGCECYSVGPYLMQYEKYSTRYYHDGVYTTVFRFDADGVIIIENA